MKTDALDRRSRFAKPQPLDTRLELTERDYALFEALDRHGRLPTPYLFEFTKELRHGYRFFKRRLTQLYNGYCANPDHHTENKDGHTCYAISYLARDWQQFQNIEARYQHIVYSLTPTAKGALGATGSKTRKPSGAFVHDLFAACFTASIELKASPNRFVFRDEILAHEKCPVERREDTTLSFTDIIPDDVFGLAYEDGGFKFFALEIDRATETINTTKNVTNSIAKKVQCYERIFENRDYRYGLPNLRVIFATVNEEHMQTMIQHVRDNVAPKHQTKFLFKAFPTFDRTWKVPKDLLTVFEPYHTTEGLVDISKRAPVV